MGIKNKKVMNTHSMNSDLKCTVSYYQNNRLLKIFKARLPETQQKMFNIISFELDEILKHLVFNTNPHLVAQITDDEGNLIYRCTRGVEGETLQIEDMAKDYYYTIYSTLGRAENTMFENFDVVCDILS